MFYPFYFLEIILILSFDKEMYIPFIFFISIIHFWL